VATPPVEILNGVLRTEFGCELACQSLALRVEVDFRRHVGEPGRQRVVAVERSVVAVGPIEECLRQFTRDRQLMLTGGLDSQIDLAWPLWW
jgi:hypothetical protein